MAFAKHVKSFKLSYSFDILKFEVLNIVYQKTIDPLKRGQTVHSCGGNDDIRCFLTTQPTFNGGIGNRTSLSKWFCIFCRCGEKKQIGRRLEMHQHSVQSNSVAVLRRVLSTGSPIHPLKF